MTDGTVVENKANALAASFAALDEDVGDTHTFTLLEGKDAFQLVNSTSLYTRRAINFEAVDGGYIPIQLMVAGNELMTLPTPCSTLIYVYIGVQRSAVY